ncbi:Type II site-specific deoxyribonuclease [uncultured Candidatus Thioglobus sp.]|nr:Type II site-specific deoxyribonuclease [uncultured Candidatus Thioglobus sp.]
MNSILTAIKSIIDNLDLCIENITDGNNRTNNMGDGLENYIKNAFADTLNINNKAQIIKKISDTFSYTGAKNNPPDLMIKSSDAIEVKKIQNKTSKLQLNSSHPKSKLTADNTRITQECRTCEDWQIKDIIYTVGHVKNTELKSLWMVYGDCYCANSNTYEQVENDIKHGIRSIGLNNNEKTNELGGVSGIDPLNISHLRIRSMWIIKNPSQVFDYLYQTDTNTNFELVVIMQKNKYDSFPQAQKSMLENINDLSINNVKIQNPNNPADLIAAKLLVFTR